MWDLHFSFVEESAKIGEPEKVIEHVLAAFESVGFVIEGARTTPVPGKKLIVKKWGAPHTGATSAFLSLRNVYKLFELTELAEQAKEYARISWMLLAGGIPLLYMIIHQRSRTLFLFLAVRGFILTSISEVHKVNKISDRSGTCF